MKIPSIFTKFFKPHIFTFTVDFVDKRGYTLKNATVIFGKSSPGTFLLNGAEEKFVGWYVDDLGLSSDFKYRKVATQTFCFWVNPKDSSNFLSCMQELRNNCFGEVCTCYKDFSSYLGPEQNYFEESILFNVAGVSHSFGQPAYKIISHLSRGSRIRLRFCESGVGSEYNIPIFTAKNHQIGWYPLSASPSFWDAELLAQLKANVSTTAQVHDKGKISGKDIWWCQVELNLRIPYSQAEQMVYIANSGYRYHLNPSCTKKIARKVPLSYANICGLSPCSRCAGDISSTV